MNHKPILFVAVVIFAVTFALFEGSIAFEFALPGEKTVPDAEQEARYEACFAQKDDEIHEIAFGTIDNPDVQKEFITSNRAAAASECRAHYPEQVMTESTPFRFNLIDLQPRYW